MQTLDFVSGLHNCLEFFQPLSRLYQAMQTRKTFSTAYTLLERGIIIRVWETVHLPLPQVNAHWEKNVGLGKGYVDSLSESWAMSSPGHEI